MLDDGMATPSSQMRGALIWNRSATVLGWRYLVREPGGDDVPAYASPARAGDLSGLPCAFVAVGAQEVFREENVWNASRLLEACVPTNPHVYAGATQGFERFVASVAVAQRCEPEVDDGLRAALVGGTA